jgi:L-amino acid N-acyltransferase YncA
MRDGLTVPPPAARPSIRGADAGDWERIAGLLTTAGLPLAGAREHLDRFLLAERDGTLIGCAAVERYGTAGLLRSVAVTPAERSHGTGAALVSRCIATARLDGLDTLVLLTTTAPEYFPRFGFRTVDRSTVPEAIRASEEFRGACPASATVMLATLSLQVRPAHRGDASAIAEIYNAGIRTRVATFETRERTTADVESWFESERFPILVAEVDGSVAGWIAASGYRPRECYSGIAEFSVYVAPPAQGQRVGDTLMREFLVSLEGAGFWKVLSRIFPENGSSRALCRRHGFREVGIYERHAMLEGIWRDVLIVERLLGEASTP